MNTLNYFTTDDLPTWNELYNHFFVHEDMSELDYNPLGENIFGINPYWKIPNNVFYLATGCNQLNKNLYNKGKYFYNKIVKLINDHLHIDVQVLYFILYNDNKYYLPHPVYILPRPTHDIHPFRRLLNNNIEVLSIMDKPLSLNLKIRESNDSLEDKIVKASDELMTLIMDEFASETNEYFQQLKVN